MRRGLLLRMLGFSVTIGLLHSLVGVCARSLIRTDAVTHPSGTQSGVRLAESAAQTITAICGLLRFFCFACSTHLPTEEVTEAETDGVECQTKSFEVCWDLECI